MPNIWETDGGVYFGFRADKPADPDKELDGVWPPTRQTLAYVGDRQLITLGPNGSGKSWRLLIPNLARLLNWSIVVVDPKGELAAHSAVYRRQGGRKVLVIDPFAVMEQTYPQLVAKYPDLFVSHGFNPVTALDAGTPDKPGLRFVDDAKKLSEGLVKVENVNDKYWPLSARALVKGLLMVIRLKFGERASLGVLRHLLGKEPEELAATIKALVALYGPNYPAVAASLNRFTKFSPENKELFGILSTALTETDWLDSPQIADDLAKGSYDFGQMKREPTTVYLVLPPEYLDTHATWLRIMITSILMPLLRSVEDAQTPVLFMLDEYAQLGRMEVIESNLALMRGYGVKLWPVLQDLQQLKEVHEKRWESFISNSGVRHLFAPQDATTQEYFSKLSGQRAWWYKTASENKSQSTGGPSHSQSSGFNTNDAVMMVPTWYQQDLGSIRRGQGVLFVAENREGKANLRYRAVLPDAREPIAAELLPDVMAMITQARRDIGGKNGTDPQN
jgi:type IV secretion system protein VirD4